MSLLIKSRELLENIKSNCKNDDELCHYLTGILHNDLQNSLVIKDFHDAGGVSIVVEAAQKFPKNLTVQILVFRLLKNTIDVDDDFYIATAIVFQNRTLVDYVMNTMINHEDNVFIQKYGCILLGLLHSHYFIQSAKEPQEPKETIAAIGSIIRAMELYPYESQIQENALKSLKMYASFSTEQYPTNCIDIINSNGLDLLLKAAKNHVTRDSITNAVNEVLGLVNLEIMSQFYKSVGYINKPIQV